MCICQYLHLTDISQSIYRSYWSYCFLVDPYVRPLVGWMVSRSVGLPQFKKKNDANLRASFGALVYE